jgi:Ca2+-binding EF-hand superfamily protein
MKTITKTLLVSSALVALVGTAALAGHHKGGHRDDGPRAERMMERLDADKDGRITREEMITTAKARFTARDKDADGVISAEDREAFRAERRAERRATRFETIDADSDGVISKDEFVAFQPERGERRGMRGERGERRGMRGHHRAQGEGRGERRGMRGVLTIEEAEARANQRFERLDSDDKGFVTLNDLKAAQDWRGRGRGKGKSRHRD